MPSANDDLRGGVEKKKGSLFDDTWATCRHVVKVVSVLLPGETNANEGAAMMIMMSITMTLHRKSCDEK